MELFALYPINKGTGILAIVLYFVIMLSLYPAVTSAFFFAYPLLFARFRKSRSRVSGLPFLAFASMLLCMLRLLSSPVSS